MKKRTLKLSVAKLVSSAALLTAATSLAYASEIIQDAEFQKVSKQYKAAWDAEDKDLQKRLAALEAKTGKKPNIIYFMWDDAAYGRVGHPMLSKLTGIHTPNIDQMAREGMTLTRMYTEPSCTPTRVATLTGRHPIRSGLTQVVFPVHAIGMPNEEVTIAEVLSEAGYATAHFGKGMSGEQMDTIGYDVTDELPGEPGGIPGTEIPATSIFSSTMRAMSRAGTWPSTK